MRNGKLTVSSHFRTHYYPNGIRGGKKALTHSALAGDKATSEYYNSLPLHNGDRLSTEEFMRICESDPRLKKVELIGGIVRMAPVGFDHGNTHVAMGGWLYYYAIHTFGCAVGADVTWEMFGDRPQPDQHLRILPEYGGKSKVHGKYGAGAPELIVEVGDSSITTDLGEKKELYHRAGADEYIVIDLPNEEVHWLVRAGRQYKHLRPDKSGVFRSRVFPGLWFNSRAYFANRGLDIIKTLDKGVKSRGHAAFVRKLAAAKKK